MKLTYNCMQIREFIYATVVFALLCIGVLLTGSLSCAAVLNRSE